MDALNEHEISKDLVAYLDGALTQEENRKMEQHLEACSVCRETLEDFKRTGELLMKWPEVAPSPGFKSRVFAQIRPARSRPDAWWPFRRLGAPLRWAATAASVLLIAGATYWVVPNFLDPNNLSESERSEIASNMDLYLNLQVISHLDTLEEMDAPVPGDHQETFVRNLG